MPLLKFGLTILFLVLLLGCSKKIIKVPELIEPPAVLLKDCIKPVFTGTTNGDLAEFIFLQSGSIEKCNEDKKALREWLSKSRVTINKQ